CRLRAVLLSRRPGGRASTAPARQSVAWGHVHLYGAVAVPAATQGRPGVDRREPPRHSYRRGAQGAPPVASPPATVHPRRRPASGPGRTRADRRPHPWTRPPDHRLLRRRFRFSDSRGDLVPPRRRPYAGHGEPYPAFADGWIG